MGYNVARKSNATLARDSRARVEAAHTVGISGGNKLANTKSAIKRIRSSERKRRINQVHRSRARTYIKRTRSLVAAGQLDEAEAMAQQAIGALDRAAQKGVIHKNNAARRKSRLMHLLKQAKQQAA
jgi:small subunit ribosomal protein S20